MTDRILIRADYWLGKDTLDLEQPWMVPEGILALDRLLAPDMRVLEFGCGGSTLFYARRCQSVLSFETKADWAQKVRQTIAARGIANAEVRIAASVADCTVQGPYDLVFVDCDDMPRLRLTELARSWATRFVVLDNYDAMGAERLDPSVFRGWFQATFNDLHWFGGGTRIYAREGREGFNPVNCSTLARLKQAVKRRIKQRTKHWWV
jgi:hypothetical protein